MNTKQSIDWIESHSAVLRFYMVPALVALVGGVYVFVYLTGGVKFVYSHSMYVPILLAGFVYGIKGGVLVGLLGGIALGPFMPLDVVTGEAQRTINWLYRTGFFSLIGFLSGAASDGVRSYLSHVNWIARHDESSMLPNRFALMETLTRKARLADNESKPGALILIHLENCMELVSAFGYALADDVVRQMATRIRRHLSNGEAVYRTAYDQTLILIEQVSGRDVNRMIGEFAELFLDPFIAKGISVHGDVRMGCVAFDRINQEPSSYLQDAQTALIAASQKGQDGAVFAPEINFGTRENLRTLGELKDALENRLLFLHYQPKVAISTGAVSGVEALMRWNHPQRGDVPPGKFVPRAELSTLIHPLTDFAIDHALAQLQRWTRQGISLSVAVNISTRNLLQRDFVSKVQARLDRYEVSSGALELELTESSLMLDIDNTLAQLKRLAGIGIVLSVDDFGTGYSSLQYLSDLPVSIIKIDQSFIRKLPLDAGAAHIVEAAVSLAHKLGMKVVAEGVETQGAYGFLRDIGCDMAQGYFIRRPAPAQEITDWHVAQNGCIASATCRR